MAIELSTWLRPVRRKGRKGTWEGIETIRAPFFDAGVGRFVTVPV